MALAATNGPMDAGMRANFSKVTSMAKGNVFAPTEIIMKASLTGVFCGAKLRTERKG